MIRGNASRGGDTMGRRLLRGLLWLFPAEFRHRYGGDILDAYEDRAQEAGRIGRRRRWAAWARTALGLLRSGAGERLHHSKGRNDRHIGPDHRQRQPAWRIVLEQLFQDLRFALRSLRQHPGMSGVAVITLALGIGATTAVFSVVNAVLLRPFEYPESDRLVRLWSEYPDGSTGTMSQPDLIDIERSVPDLEAAVGYSPSGYTLTGFGEPEVISNAVLSDGLLRVFGLVPELGRDIDRADNIPNGPRVVVIGHRFWQQRLGGRPDVLGATLDLDSEPREIVGVAPPGFDFPDRAQLWGPMYLETDGCGRGCRLYRGVGRLEADATLAATREQLDTLAARLRQEYEETNTGTGFRIERFADAAVSNVRDGLWLILGAVLLVLLIACANVANLLLERGVARRAELAVRAAIGAGRRRLAQQTLLEGLFLAMAGALLGMLVALVGVEGLLALAPPGLPRLEAIGVDPVTLAFALAVAMISALLFGALPAWRAARVDPADDLVHAGSRALSGDGGRARSLLLVLEVALSLVLLVGASLLLRTFWEMARQDLGFDATGATQFTLSLPEARYDGEGAVRFFAALDERLSSLPEVEAVGSAFGSPLSDAAVSSSVDLLDRPQPRVAIVSRTFAAIHYPDGEVLGKQIRLSLSFSFPETERSIVGIVADVRSRSITRAPSPEVYVPQAQFGSDYMTVLVRGSGVSVASLRRVVGELDPRDVVAQAQISLVEAIDAALSARPGRAVEADLEAEVTDGSRDLFFEIMVVTADGGLHEVVVDPDSGEVRSDQGQLDAEELDELAGFQAALRYSDRSLSELIASSEAVVRGTPVGAELELEGRSPQADVTLVSGRYLVEVEVEARAGQLTEIELAGLPDADHEREHEEGSDAERSR